MHRIIPVLVALAACADDPKASGAPRDSDTATTDVTTDDTTSIDTTTDTAPTTTVDTGTDGACEDAHVGNDAVELALPAPFGEDLALTPGQVDHWTIEVPSGQMWGLTVETQSSGDPGSLALSLLQADGQLTSPTTYGLYLPSSGVDPITYTVAVHVQAEPDACVAYQLVTEVLPSAVCDDGVGDSWMEAAPLVRDGRNMVGTDLLHNGDEDWFTATAIEDLDGGFVLDGVGAERGVVIELYGDPTAPPLVATTGGYSYEYFELDLSWSGLGPQPPGVYYVRVLALGADPVCGPLDYELIWSH